ncbi:MAG: phage antirepressor protein [Bacteroidetes bacterium HGW-Bacteroidetes-15]|nr:MAG: phage antirepressor protein [Bacteroidetes bacterium HGW-Bacteroidetes-15]
MKPDNALVVFQGKQIRRIRHDEQWYFSVVDVVEVLTDSPAPRQYWGVLKKRESQLLTICLQLKLPSADGKYYKTDCVNTENAFRLIQSIPSKKAEPFKRWLAKVGYERIQEIENPELAQERMKQIYEQKGYSKEWIDKRLRGIAIRQELTDEWQDRGIERNVDYAILTNEITRATFGKTIEEYKRHKNLNRENLGDHMTDLELIFNMLGEKVTTEITINKDAQKFEECKKAAKEGGGVAGKARLDAEEKIGKTIISGGNYLTEPEKVRKIRKIKK